MTTFVSGPVNIQQGNTASFVVEYLDSSGNYSLPAGGSIEVSYTNTTNSPTTDTVTLSLANSYFTGSWAATTAGLGLATWVVFASGSTTAYATGQIRVIEREAGA